MCRHLRNSQSGPFPAVPPSVGWLAPSVHSAQDRASLLMGVLAVGFFLFHTAGSWVCIRGTAVWFRTSMCLHNGNRVRSFKQTIPLYWICCEISRPQVISRFLGTVNYSFTKFLPEFQREQNESCLLTDVYRYPSLFIARYNFVWTPWIATTRKPTGMRLNKARRERRWRAKLIL